MISRGREIDLDQIFVLSRETTRPLQEVIFPYHLFPYERVEKLTTDVWVVSIGEFKET